MPSDPTGFHVHLCLYSAQSAPPFTENLFTREESIYNPLGEPHSFEEGQPRSLYEIARKVDRPLDARFTRVSIEWLDRPKTNIARGRSVQLRQASMGPDGHTKARKSGRESPKPKGAHDGIVPSLPASPTSAKGLVSSSPSTPVARFLKENSFHVNEDDQCDYKSDQGPKSGSLEVSFGIVHLFRDDASLKDMSNAKTRTTLEDDSGCILAILGVPSHIGPADFLQLVEPAADAISQVRMIREEMAGRCMVMLKFRDPANAEEFHKMYADQPFDPAEDPDELCRVVYVTKVTVSSTSTLPFAYPLLANSDPWPIMPSNQVASKDQSANAVSRIASLNELPTCPVCLERMDSSVTGLMTVTCQHTFHCSCLSKWSDSRCPVCRYTQSRLTKKGHMLPSFVPEHGLCAVCGTGSDLWVCLICATVGCGRYKAGHAHRHYQETGHLYSLELETQRVWDYAGDGYVHRLIQSKAEFKSVDEGGPTPKAFREAGAKTTSKDGQVMEASGSSVGAGRGEAAGSGGMLNVEDKMEALGLEYSHLLSTQLESQRAFYEDQVRAYQQRVEQAESMSQRSAVALEESQRERNSIRQRFEATTSRHENMHANLDVALKRVKKMDEDLRGERLMSQGLVARIDKLTLDEKERDAEMKLLREENLDLKEQVRDLMFFVEARTKVANEGGEELRDGSLSMPPPRAEPSDLTSSSSKGKKKKKVARKPPTASVSGSAPTSNELASDEKESEAPSDKVQAVDEEHDGK